MVVAEEIQKLLPQRYPAALLENRITEQCQESEPLGLKRHVSTNPTFHRAFSWAVDCLGADL